MKGNIAINENKDKFILHAHMQKNINTYDLDPRQLKNETVDTIFRF
jgi:hypothetical protein